MLPSSDQKNIEIALKEIEKQVCLQFMKIDDFNDDGKGVLRFGRKIINGKPDNRCHSQIGKVKLVMTGPRPLCKSRW